MIIENEKKVKMDSKKYIIFGAIIVIISTVFQMYYYNVSESDNNGIYQDIFLKKAKTHFENIMLKKAQGLDPGFSITNELANIKFQVIDPDKNGTDKLERDIIARLKRGEKKEYFLFNDNKSYFYYYAALEMKENCLGCHEKYHVGEIAGGIKISIPTVEFTTFYKELTDSKKLYVFLNILFTFIIVILSVSFFSKNKQRHNDLKRSQRNLEKAEEMAKLGHWRLDMRTYDISLSKNMKKILGLGIDHIDLKYVLNRIVVKKDKRKVLGIFLSSFKKQQDTKFEFQIKRQDNGEKRYVDCQITYILDDEGRIIVSIGTVQDVTDFIKLRNELSILKQAVEEAPISIVITDEKGNIEYANPSFTKVTGYELSEVIGKNPRILKSEYTKPHEYLALWENISSGKTWGGTFKNINKEGKEFWELAFISPVFSPGSKRVCKYIAVKEEITKELYLQRELENKEELMIVQSRHAAMGEMISMIAHQWRQPATVIALSANNILVDVKLDMVDNESLQRNAQDIIEQTEYLSHTIDDFRNFFKPNKQKTLVSVKEVMDETMVMMRATLENNDIELIENYGSNIRFFTYEKELMQVFINILKNAQEILKEKKISTKQIVISEFIKKNNVIVQICDNAGGIAEENIYKIFEPYFTTKDEMNGTGLGLYISKVIIEKHLNGTIRAFNKGDGACFEISIAVGDKEIG